MASKTIRQEMMGGITIRLVQQDNKQFAGVVIGKDRNMINIYAEPGETRDDVWERLRSEALRSHPSWVGYEGALDRFIEFFPNGFKDKNYFEQERNYKWEAKRLLDELIPLETALDSKDLGEKALRVFQKTNLLSHFETMRVRDALRSGHGDRFVHGAAEFVLQNTVSGLHTMANALKLYDAAKWTVVTYLPFLWQPEEHMFLKPEVTKFFADQVGHEFTWRYKTALDIDIYESLQDLAAKTNREISGLNPRDGIDVQSFIWVVGRYE